MAGLAKQADGLPRYMMDCGWWLRGHKWRARTLAEMGLHEAGVSYCNQHGTDGVLPGPVEELAAALGLPLTETKRTLPKLVERKAWKKRPDDDYEILGFLDHNPSRAEVNTDRRKKAEKSAKGNHQRWHVEKNEPDKDCPYCFPEGIPQGTVGDSPDESHTESLWMEGKDGREGMEGTSSSGFVTEEPPDDRRPKTDDDGPPRWFLIEGERQADLPRRPGISPIADRDAWLAAAAKRVFHQHGAQVAAWLETEPDLTDEQIAKRIAPHQETMAEQMAHIGLAP